MRDTGEFYRRPKKELAKLNRELVKLEKSLGGMKRIDVYKRQTIHCLTTSSTALRLLLPEWIVDHLVNT